MALAGNRTRVTLVGGSLLYGERQALYAQACHATHEDYGDLLKHKDIGKKNRPRKYSYHGGRILLINQTPSRPMGRPKGNTMMNVLKGKCHMVSLCITWPHTQPITCIRHPLADNWLHQHLGVTDYITSSLADDGTNISQEGSINNKTVKTLSKPWIWLQLRFHTERGHGPQLDNHLRH